MPTVTAWQHIYSNVEASQSPSGKGGFQTLFYSHDGLSQEDVRFIERRVFYLPGDQKPTKRIFCVLPNGNLVFSAVVPLEGKDSAGRSGRHLAHSFILPQSEFQNNILCIVDFLKSAPFAVNLEQVFSDGDSETGNISKKTISVSPTRCTGLTRWDTPDLLRLLHLAINAEARSKETKAVAFVGSTEIIEETLAASSILLPDTLLPLCTFDTVFQNGGNVRHTYYWAVGFDRTPRQQTLTAINLQSDSLSDSIPLNDLSTYEQWIAGCIRQKSMEEAISLKDVVFPMCLFLEGKGGNTAPRNVPEWITEQLMLLAETHIKAQLRTRMDKVLPSILGDRIFDRVHQNLTPQATIQALEQGFNVDHLLPALLTSYKATGLQKPGRSERSTLEEVLQDHPHSFLSLVLACWNNEMEEVNSKLNLLDDASYSNFLNLALPNDLANQKDLLIPRRTAAFARALSMQDDFEGKHLLTLAKDLIEAGAERETANLAPYLNSLKKKELKSLKKILDKSEIMSPIVSDIDDLLDSGESDKGLFRRLF